MIVTFEEDIDGNLVLPLPPELSNDWEIGDTIRWLINEDGTILIINKSRNARKGLQT